MKWNELKKRIIDEYNRRNLKSKARYRALNKIEDFLKKQYPNILDDVQAALPADKNVLKRVYEYYKNKNINGAESSVINEIYTQLQNNK